MLAQLISLGEVKVEHHRQPLMFLNSVQPWCKLLGHNQARFHLADFTGSGWVAICVFHAANGTKSQFH